MSIYGKIDFLHNIVFKRFVRMPYGHLLDYSAPDIKDTPIPTKEECDKCMPNAYGWWTPIENGAFFTSLYLYALMDKYDAVDDESLHNDVMTLLNGLYVFQDAGNQKGFICRGVADDGVSHFPLGSADQTGPWLLALYRVYRSPKISEKIKLEIKERIRVVCETAFENKLSLVTECDGVFSGSYADPDWRGCCNNLFIYGMMRELVGGEWAERFEEAKHEHPKGNLFERLQIVSHGFAPDMVHNNGLTQFWIDICSHLCLKELAIVDEKEKNMYLCGTMLNGATVQRFMRNFKLYIPNQKMDYDFRKLKRLYEPFDGNISIAAPKGLKQCDYWEENIVPARKQEHHVLGQALFAIWTAVTSGYAPVIEDAKKAIEECLEVVDFEKLHLCYSFVAESALIYLKYNNL
ncbi:MAG: hypothetical protein ACI39F_07540 [Acutalibacteraceae bacterium]